MRINWLQQQENKLTRHTPKTGCKDIFWVLPSHFSFNTPAQRSQACWLTSKALTSDRFFCLWLILGHLPTFRWQVLDIKQAGLPRGSLCGFRWRLESFPNLHCNEWLGSVSAGEHCRNSVTASLWTSGEGGMRVCDCTSLCVWGGLRELESTFEGQVVSCVVMVSVWGWWSAGCLNWIERDAGTCKTNSTVYCNCTIMGVSEFVSLCSRIVIQVFPLLLPCRIEACILKS